ncbi:tRNA pseudouridine(55) synthase TruB [Altericista sp. CCNU0014]|uniref:tRNA pseudouridine(55) synthase TruB n=1 Tax=Altericista sp. CCNU0014 TaxID=3082949 RepID=UPI003850B7E5
MFGFINLDKPTAWTSHDCVARVRRLLKTKRVGHGGTLDPLATGVLPIAVGAATRLLQFLPTPKAYRATIRLGIKTTTDDLAGEVLQVRSAAAVTRERLIEALKMFRGTLQQVPPIYSAIQVDGQRLYKLARKGESVLPEPRTVEVYKIEVLDWQVLDSAHPEVTLQIACGPGTYIRSIARDLGEVLQTGGTLARLVRTQSCGFDLADSLSLETLEEQVTQGSLLLADPAAALKDVPHYALDGQFATRWCQGRSVEVDSDAMGEAWVRVHDASAHFLGMGLLSEGFLVPKVVLNATTV